MRIGWYNLTLIDFYDIIKKAVKTDNNQALTAINKNFNYKYILRVYTKVGINPISPAFYIISKSYSSSSKISHSSSNNSFSNGQASLAVLRITSLDLLISPILYNE